MNRKALEVYRVLFGRPRDISTAEAVAAHMMGLSEIERACLLALVAVGPGSSEVAARIREFEEADLKAASNSRIAEAFRGWGGSNL